LDWPNALVPFTLSRDSSQTSERVGLGERHLRKWARRFIERGVEGLQDRPRPGRVPFFFPCGVVFGEGGL